MKRFLLALAAALLTASVFGSEMKSADDLLKEKVPDSADFVLFVDGSPATRTGFFLEFRDLVMQYLKEFSLPESILNCRVLTFGSAREGWFGILIQSRDGTAKTLFDLTVATAVKGWDPEKFICDGRSFICRYDDSQTGPIGKLYSDDLMLLAFGKNDPSSFRGGNCGLFKKIEMENRILAAAGNVRLSDNGPDKGMADSLFRKYPFLQDLKEFSLDVVPSAEDDETAELRLILPDDKAAAGALGSLNAFLDSSMIPTKAPQLEKALVRSTEKNVLTISLRSTKPLLAVVKEGRKQALRAQSIHNLKMIGTCLMLYESDNNRLPASLSELIPYTKSVPATFIAPLDKTAKPHTGKEIRPENTSYAYVGSGVVLSSISLPSRLPAAFEKPSVIGEDGVCAVLYFDGHVGTVKVRGRTCREIARELTSMAPEGDAGIKAKIVANAGAVDQEKF